MIATFIMHPVRIYIAMPSFDIHSFFLLALAFIAILAFWHHRFYQLYRGLRSPPLQDPIKNPELFDENGKLRTDLFDENGRKRTIACGSSIPFDTWRRCVFDGEGCTIYAWPCHGGVVIKDNADIVDMAFLGFDRFNPPTHRFSEEEQDEENNFACELLKIGGKLWISQHREADVRMGFKEAEGEERMCRFLGWDPPDGTGGVWALEFDIDEEDPPETSRLRMALTMEERYTVLEKLGAKFYKDPRGYEGLKAAYAGFHHDKSTLT
jgi:hypothetical protein